MLEKIKSALGITSNVFDGEITDNIAVSLADMGSTSDITNLDETDSLIIKAVTTYCAYQHNMLHGNAALAEKLKASYDSQKMALLMASQYTNYGEN